MPNTAESKGDITLKITVLRQDGKPYSGTVDIECQHQTLSDRRKSQGVDASKVIAIGGLKRSPQGLYQVTVTPTDVFAPQGQFVNIPASGAASVQFTIGEAQVTPVEHPHAKERQQFRSLILANPNYFGNIANSPIQPVLPISSNTFYEEIGCVGYEPQLSLLETVVYIKQATGYGGPVCSNGTKEYVRYYLSFNDGVSWEDQGEVSFTVYDVPPEPRRFQRLEYSCSLKISPPRMDCSKRNILKARAILSWNTPNPPNTPDHVPVWGEVHNTNIQIAKRTDYILADFLNLAQAKLPIGLQDQFDLQVPVPPVPPPVLSVGALHAAYAIKKVEPHRYALKEAVAYLEQPELTANLMTATAAPPFAALGLSDIFVQILAADGSKKYEELECIGYFPGETEFLAGVVRVKLPFGFSGGPCTAGSWEYVTFWADFDNSGNFATCLGQTSVNTHDFDPMPEGGLEYAVYLPVDFDAYRQKCEAGPKVVHIRAILSWNALPPCGNPNYKPVWGNRLETMILLRPGKPVTTQVPLLSRAGNMSHIDINALGLANGFTLETGFEAHDSPFGGNVKLAGKIPLAVPGMKYRIMKKRHIDPVSSFAPIVNEPGGVGLYISEWNSVTGWTTTYTVKHALPLIADGYYEYEDYSSTHFVESNLMGFWQTNILDDGGLFDLRIDLSVDGNPANDLHSNTVTLLIDNTPPIAALSIDLGGQCGDFTPGAEFKGKFTATDIHFRYFYFQIEPSGPPNFPSHGVKPDPPRGDSNLYGGAILDPGLSNEEWTVDTGRTPLVGEPHVGPMDPCGYAIILHVWDRTIVNNGGTSNYAQASVGFCLRRP